MATRRARRGPGRPRRRAGEEASSERILRAATRLFAERGFDGVSTRDIAAEVDLNIATVHHHVGSKADLYDAVFARVYAEEEDVVRHAAEEVRAHLETAPGDAIGGLHALLDAYIDFAERRPEMTMLWLRRWLQPTRHRRLDEEYALPLYRLVEDLLAQAGEPAPRAAVRSIVWAVHGHITAAQGGAGDGTEFRGFAHRLLDALYGAS
jgi:TetR/AcrR family transcriptional regulator, regulator of cefoperazone and chloramphenicol sensitivity